MGHGTVGLKEWIIPQDDKFFDILDEIGENGVEAAAELETLLHDETDTRVQAERIKELEHHGDELVHDMYELLNRSFITPIDHGDLAEMVAGLDDFIDYIDASASRINLYNVEPTEGMRSLGSLIKRQSRELKTAVVALRDLRDPDEAERAAIEVHALENAADAVLNEALASLLEGDDAIHVIKHKEVYENLETATDAAEEAANIIGDILMKNA